jgi:hypothetical protein
MSRQAWVNCSSGAFFKIEVAHRFGMPANVNDRNSAVGRPRFATAASNSELFYDPPQAPRNVYTLNTIV